MSLLSLEWLFGLFWTRSCLGKRALTVKSVGRSYYLGGLGCYAGGNLGSGSRKDSGRMSGKCARLSVSDAGACAVAGVTCSEKRVV